MKRQFEEKVASLNDQAKYAEVKEREVRLEEVEEKLKKKEEDLVRQMNGEKKEIEEQF